MKIVFVLLTVLLLVSIPLMVQAEGETPGVENPAGTPDKELEVAQDSPDTAGSVTEPPRNKVLEIITIIFVIAVFVLLYWWMPKVARKKEESGA